MAVRLHVNVDHVATLRQARGTDYPDPVEAAVLCERALAEGITVHLREDRRHIQDHDVQRLRTKVKTLLNLEMAATGEMLAIAERIRPDFVTWVPERREERTTEGGLDVRGQLSELQPAMRRMHEASLSVSLFIDPDPEQVKASLDLGAAAIELHTGDFARARGADFDAQLKRLAAAAELSKRRSPATTVAAGHGLTLRNVRKLVAAVPQVEELNIGHALVADAVLEGLAETVARYRAQIALGEQER